MIFSIVLNGEIANTKISAENLFSLPICIIMEWVMDMDENHVGANCVRPQTTANQKTGDQWSPLQTNFGRELVFSADLCYNGVNEKPLPLGSEAARGE